MPYFGNIISRQSGGCAKLKQRYLAKNRSFFECKQNSRQKNGKAPDSA